MKQSLSYLKCSLFQANNITYKNKILNNLHLTGQYSKLKTKKKKLNNRKYNLNTRH